MIVGLIWAWRYPGPPNPYEGLTVAGLNEAPDRALGESIGRAN